MNFLDLIRQRVGPPLLQAIRHVNEDMLTDIFVTIGRRAPFARNIGFNLVLLFNMQTEAPELEKSLKDETRASIFAAHCRSDGDGRSSLPYRRDTKQTGSRWRRDL